MRMVHEESGLAPLVVKVTCTKVHSALRGIEDLDVGLLPNLKYIMNAHDYDLDVLQSLEQRGILFLDRMDEMDDLWEYPLPCS